MGEMYKPQNNGPHTMLAATINASQVSITVENASILPDAPNVLTIGTEEDAELVKLESKTGNILSVTRGFNGTTPKAWDSGAWIYRAITAQDIEELQERTKKIVKTLTAAEFEALTTEEKAALFASGVRVIAVEGDLDPDELARYGYIINSDGTTTPLSDPHALRRGESAQNAEKLGGNPPAYYTPYDNRVDNGNFRQFVAQAGIGGNHGTQAYGGDRWILDSGTITGEANANGLGYGSITLNGTIRQIIAEPQETMDAFIGMISGTATVAYTYTDGVGELTITSAGGVLDWVMLLPGEWESAPPYVPKGYSAELVECRRYYVKIETLVGYAATAIVAAIVFEPTSVRTVIQLPTEMRTNPTCSIRNIRFLQLTSSGGKNISITSASFSQLRAGLGYVIFTASGATTGASGLVMAADTLDAYIEFSADLL